MAWLSFFLESVNTTRLELGFSYDGSGLTPVSEAASSMFPEKI